MDEPEQLGCLKRHGEEQQNIIDPGDRALRLVPVKPEQEDSGSGTLQVSTIRIPCIPVRI